MKKFLVFGILFLLSFKAQALNLYLDDNLYFDIKGELNMGISTWLPYTKAYPVRIIKEKIYGKTLEDRLKPYKASTDFIPRFNFALGLDFGYFVNRKLTAYIDIAAYFNALAIFDKHKYMFDLERFILGLKGDFILGELLLGTKKDAINTLTKPLFGNGKGFKLHKKAFALSYHLKPKGVEYDYLHGLELMFAAYAPLPYKIEAYKGTDIVKKVYPAAFSFGYKQKLLVSEYYDYINSENQRHFLNLAMAFSSYSEDYKLPNPLDLLHKIDKPRSRTWQNEFTIGAGYTNDFYSVGLGYSLQFQSLNYDVYKSFAIRKPNKHNVGIHFDIKPADGLKLYVNLDFGIEEAANIVSYWYEKLGSLKVNYKKQEVFVAYQVVDGKWQKVLSSPYGNIYSFGYFFGGSYEVRDGLHMTFKIGGISQLSSKPRNRFGREDDTLYGQKVFYQQIKPNEELVLTSREFEKVTAFSKFNIDFGFIYKF